LPGKTRPRKPLILQGVRQCGKTFILNQFGRENYSKVAYFNFEDQPEFCSIFQKDLDTDRIIFDLSAYFGSIIERTNTLIIFDEIQFCPKAITSLKYFCEKNNDYHIAAAGSLLGIQLAEPTSYPVGKVDLLSLYPLSFEEFLIACGQTQLFDYVIKMDPSQSPAKLFTDKLTACLTDYQICGGMPEAVSAYIQTRDIQAVDKILDNLLLIYERDFRKHARLTDAPKIDLIWHSVPSQLARIKNKFIFKEITEGARARDYENALQWLVNAGMIHRVSHISQPRIPLSAYEDPRHFKIFAFDIGLLRRLAKLSAASIIMADEHYAEFKGALAENFFAQEMVAYGMADLYFWTSGNMAEIDFVIANQNRIIPVEIKAADNVRARSLAVYSEKFEPAIKVRVSMKGFAFSKETRLIALPHYMLFRFKDLTLI
jgi:predicted AAA+ superfamily ATPase